MWWPFGPYAPAKNRAVYRGFNLVQRVATGQQIHVLVEHVLLLDFLFTLWKQTVKHHHKTANASRAHTIVTCILTRIGRAKWIGTKYDTTHDAST
jgi:hypothetical protein